MPVYGVRWPDFSLSIVEANNEKELFWRLDEIAEPQAVNFKKFDNPLHLNLKLKIDAKLNEKKSLKEDSNAEELLMKRMENLMEDVEFCDLTVIIDGQEIRCHKAILASNKYFRSLLQSNMKEVKGDRIFLSEVSCKVFRTVLRYLYLSEVQWQEDGDRSVEFLCDLLKYSHMIGMSNLVDQSVEKLSLYFERTNWEDNESQNMDELVKGIHISAQLSLEDLHCKLTDILTSKLKSMYSFHLNEEERFKLAAERLESLRALDVPLAEKFEKDKAAEDRLKEETERFFTVVSDVRAKSYIQNLKKACKRFLQSSKIENIKGSPYMTIVSTLIDAEKPSDSLMKTCCQAFNVLAEFGFPVDKEDKKIEKIKSIIQSSPIGQLASTVVRGPALYLASLHGNVPLVRGLLNVGANPSVQVRPNGETILHVINEKIRSTNDMERILSDSRNFPGGIFGLFALRRRQAPHSESELNSLREVLRLMMENKGYNNVSEVPYHAQNIEVDPQYVEELFKGFESSRPSIPFALGECEGQTDSDFFKELGELLHPRVAEIAAGVDEESCPEEEESITALKNRVKLVVGYDLEDATRASHPDPYCKKFGDSVFEDEEDEILSDDSDFLFEDDV